MEPIEVVRFLHADQAHAVAKDVFESLKRRLQVLLPEAEIHHVGSTAVSGSITKGDLDILIRVQPRTFKSADDVLAQHFPRNTGSTRTPGFSAFEHHAEPIPVGIQLTANGGSEDDFLTFREAMAGQPDWLMAYNQLKLRYDGQSMEAYREAKSLFIDDCLRQARSAPDHLDTCVSMRIPPGSRCPP